MILVIEQYKYTCANCNKDFLVDMLPGDYNYGTFLLRSEGLDNIAYLDSFSDQVFNEFKNLLYGFLVHITNEIKKVDIFQNLFGICCDPDKDGSLFNIRIEPKCPFCGMRKILKFTSLNPSKLIKKDIPIITHNKWNSMKKEQKINLIDNILKKCT